MKFFSWNKEATRSCCFLLSLLGIFSPLRVICIWFREGKLLLGVLPLIRGRDGPLITFCEWPVAMVLLTCLYARLILRYTLWGMSMHELCPSLYHLEQWYLRGFITLYTPQGPAISAFLPCTLTASCLVQASREFCEWPQGCVRSGHDVREVKNEGHSASIIFCRRMKLRKRVHKCWCGSRGASSRGQQMGCVFFFFSICFCFWFIIFIMINCLVLRFIFLFFLCVCVYNF